MIVIKTWTTRKKTKTKWGKFVYNGMRYNTRERDWRGVFILGFLPILITCTSTKYYIGY